MTSFLTPFGRFCYCKVPFGIASRPEVYQDTIDQSTLDTENITGLVDDVCVMSSDVDSHDKYLFPILQRLQDIGVTLNIANASSFNHHSRLLSIKSLVLVYRRMTRRSKQSVTCHRQATSQSLEDFWAWSISSGNSAVNFRRRLLH